MFVASCVECIVLKVYKVFTNQQNDAKDHRQSCKLPIKLTTETMQICGQKEVKKLYILRFLLVLQFLFEVVLRSKMCNFLNKNFLPTTVCIDYVVGETETYQYTDHTNKTHVFSK